MKTAARGVRKGKGGMRHNLELVAVRYTSMHVHVHVHTGAVLICVSKNAVCI